jgi:hypothetical protein
MLIIGVNPTAVETSQFPSLLVFFFFFFFFFNRHCNPCGVMACSIIVEYSQQEGFYRVPLPAARQTPNLEDQ